MKRLMTALLATPLCIAALSTQAEVQTYSFHGHSGHSAFEFPGLQLRGEVKGELQLERSTPHTFPPSDTEFNHTFPPSNTEFNISKFSLNFESAPNLTVTDFQYNSDINAYVASVDGAWVFKTVNVEIHNIDTEGTQEFYYRVSVETSKNFIDNHLPGPFYPDTTLVDGSGTLVNETPFKTVDIASATIGGKLLSVELNGNLGSNLNPENGMVGQGIELKVLWFGRGEKVFYIPAPSVNIKPIGIVMESHSFDGHTEYEYFIRYEENGSINEAPRAPLQPLLDALFPSL